MKSTKFMKSIKRKTLKTTYRIALTVLLGALAIPATAQDFKTEIPEFLTTPDRVESHLGTLEFKDGYPVGDTATKIQDELDYLHGLESFMNSIQGVSLYAMRKGFLDAGISHSNSRRTRSS